MYYLEWRLDDDYNVGDGDGVGGDGDGDDDGGDVNVDDDKCYDGMQAGVGGKIRGVVQVKPSTENENESRWRMQLSR